jgi:hypothetical protein
MFKRSTKNTNLTRFSNPFDFDSTEVKTDTILYAIVTNNLNTLKYLLNKDNINTIIDKKNNYTSLHYAVTLPNNDITKFIIELGGDPKIKQSEGIDAFELSLKSGKHFIFNYFQQIQQDKYTNLEKVNTNLEKDNDNLKVKIDNLRNENIILIESIDKYIDKTNKLNDLNETKDIKIIKLNEEIVKYNIINTNLNNLNENKDTEINKLKRDLEESDKAFNNLLKKNKK